MFFGKKKFRLASMIACGILASALFTGCGGDSGSSGGGDKAAAGDEIVIGSNFELTGNHAQYGANANNGLKLAIKEANDAGGVNGKMIKIVEADAKSEAAESVNAATKLISDDKVVALIGPAVTANVIAESQVATDNMIPVIGPAATNPDVTVENGEVKPYIFRACFIDPQQSEVMAQFASKDLNAKTAVLYLDSSSDYSKSLGKIVKQARELGITAAILGTDGWDDSKVIDIAGKDALNNTYFCTHYFEGDEEVQDFIKAYKGEYNNDPNVFAALGYDAGKMLINAIERGGDDSQKIRDNIETIKDLKVGTGVITMDAATHNPIKGIVVIETKDGVRELKAKIAPEG